MRILLDEQLPRAGRELPRACEQVMTIRKTRIVAGPLGRPLSPGRMEQVERCILTALDIVL